MFATDFLFDQHYASDFGLMICSFDQSPETASGGEIEYNTVKTPGRDRFSFYGAQRNTAIEWHFSICKNPDQNQTSYFTQYEESRIAKWLLQTDGYKLFHFCQEGYEDIFYHACINMTPHQFLGQTVGFDLTVTSDCAYGFTSVITQKAVLNETETSLVLEFRVLSDVKACILPRVRIRGTGSFQISNESDGGHPAATFQNLSGGETQELIMDSDADTVFIQNKDTVVPLPNPDMFNWRFLRLVDGVNRIVLQKIPKTESTESSFKTSDTNNIKIEIQYREPRRIIV